MLGGLAENERLIPAHAGKTWPRRRRVLMRRAHPRSRGENTARALGIGRQTGSSPLTRGKPHSSALDAHGQRLIPAHAGKTNGHRIQHTNWWAHPRSRGENKAVSTLARKHVGSSPLTRGKREDHQDGRNRRGLIPAHAGKTPPTPVRSTRRRAHPRSRGENARGIALILSSRGSSPLTRGKRHLEVGLQHLPGLIPAHAGKTPRLPSQALSRRAHPRSRGENKRSDHTDPGSSGSSPLTRGKRRGGAPTRRPPRLIPAHAGKT